MGLKFRGIIGPKLAGSDKPEIADKQTDFEGQSTAFDGEKNAGQNVDSGETSDTSTTSEKRDLQFGVQAAEATLQVWTRNHLIAAYLL